MAGDFSADESTKPINSFTLAGLGKKPMTYTRRRELAQLALECSDLFDKFKVEEHEKYYAGRLCQAMLDLYL